MKGGAYPIDTTVADPRRVKWTNKARLAAWWTKASKKQEIKRKCP